MKSISFLFLMMTVAPPYILAQVPVLSAQHAYGGTFADLAFDLKKTADGGFIMAGYASSKDGDVTGLHGTSSDYYIVKLDAAQHTQWTKTLGGTGTEEAFSICQTNDLGYIIAGYSESDDGDVTGHHDPVYQRDVWIVKLNASGAIIWERSLGGSGTDIAYCIQQTTDGGYIIAGETFSFDGDVNNPIANGDYWIVKLDATGNISWEKTFGGTNADNAKFIQQTKDGGYIIAGNSNSTDIDVTGHHGTYLTSDCWVLKINAAGVKQWMRSLGGSSNDEANCIRQTKDGGFLLAGNTSSSDGDVSGQHGSSEAWLVKLTPQGSVSWQHAYGGTSAESAFNIDPVNDGGFLIAGSAYSKNDDVNAYHGNGDSWIFKVNSIGTLQWGNTYGGANDETATAVRATADGSYFAAGYTNSYDQDAAGNHGGYDMLLLKLGTVPLTPVIATNSVAPNQICWEQPLTVNYTATGIFNPGNIFTAQISDNNSGFVNASNIGVTNAVTSGNISCTIPSSLKPSPGNNYYIRVISSDPPVIGGAFLSGLKLKCTNPDGLKATEVTSSSAKLSWKAGSCPLSYTVKWKPSNQNVWDSIFVTTTSVNVGNLLPNTMYDFRVKEKCASSPEVFSDWSGKKNFTTDPLRTDGAMASFDNLDIYPNPVTDQLHIKFSGTINGTLIITNMHGEILLMKDITAAEINVDVSTFTTGIYLLQLQSATGSSIRKFEKE